MWFNYADEQHTNLCVAIIVTFASMILVSVRTGFLHLAEALAYRRDSEVAVRGIIASLRAGEKCNAEPELIRKGTSLFNKSILSEP